MRPTGRIIMKLADIQSNFTAHIYSPPCFLESKWLQILFRSVFMFPLLISIKYWSCAQLLQAFVITFLFLLLVFLWFSASGLPTKQKIFESARNKAQMKKFARAGVCVCFKSIFLHRSKKHCYFVAVFGGSAYMCTNKPCIWHSTTEKRLFMIFAKYS